MSVFKLVSLLKFVERIPAAIQHAGDNIADMLKDPELSKKLDDLLKALEDFVLVLEGKKPEND